MRLEFPENFYWGAATSSHQVEGNNHNDWSVWEKENAQRLSKESNGKYPPENYISGRACDHYNRFREDFDIAKSLGHNAHRFSIEWSRIEPEEGKFDEKEIEHYRQVISALTAQRVEPFVTLWHWTIPPWFRDIGGWTNKKSVSYFVRYAEKMAQVFPEVRFWITLNETNVQTSLAYLKGQWPPVKKSLFQYLTVNRHLSQAHCTAYRAIKKINPQMQIGVAHNIVYFTQSFSFFKRFIWNHLFLKSIRGCQDFIGANYYHSDRETEEYSEFMNWSIDPEGLYCVLKDLKKYKVPIYITENGLADTKDEKREKFIKEHLKWTHKAISERADVRGYFYWSLLDNFEWDKGFWPRFGLVEIDYKTMRRKIRNSALEYAKICTDNALDTDL